MKLQDSIAKCVLDCFSNYIFSEPSSKDSLAASENQQWTCLSGIVLETYGQDFTCLALGAGVKCLNINSVSPYKVSDSHAEILCKRAFRRFLLEEISAIRDTGKSLLLENDNDEYRQFRIKPGLKLHFYVSQPPCGDASMETLAAQVNMNSDFNKQRTLYKRQQQGINLNLIRGRNVFDQFGCLRTKPGRNDCIPCNSHSCSDKILLWQCIGIQGALLSILIPNPIVFDTITISVPVHLPSLQRAFIERSSHIIIKPPGLYSSSLVFYFSLPQLMHLNRAENIKPAHEGINWYFGADAEKLVQGVKQGASSKHPHFLNERTQSRLSRVRLFRRYLEITESLAMLPQSKNYRNVKLSSTYYQQRKQTLLKTDPLLQFWQGNSKEVQNFDLV